MLGMEGHSGGTGTRPNLMVWPPKGSMTLLGPKGVAALERPLPQARWFNRHGARKRLPCGMTSC